MNYRDWIKGSFNRETDWALVTGGTSGIGLAYAEALCQAGCSCILLSDETSLLDEVAQSLSEKYKVVVRSFFCNLADFEATVTCCQEIIDSKIAVRILINNAGFGLKGGFDSIPLQRYKEIVNVNALAQTVLSYFFLPLMRKEGRGLHINVATINVVSPIPYNSVYTATKFYVYAYALAVAQEYAGSGICFQVLLPGTTATPFHAKQGSKATAMTMTPETVVGASLADVLRTICIPNRGDLAFYYLAPFVPIRVRIRLASWVAQKRLGLKY